MKRSIVSLSMLVLVGACACATAEAPVSERQGVAQEEEPMRVVRVLLKVKPEQEEAFLAYLGEEAVAVRQLEGCVRYQLFKTAAGPTEWLLYEEWASEAAFDAYKASDLLKKSFEVLGPMMAGPPNSAYYDATVVD